MTFDIDPGQGNLQDIVYSFAAPRGFEFNQPHTGPCFAARSSGLYSSIDGGSTWHSMLGSLQLNQDIPVLSLAVSPAYHSDKTLVAGFSGGLLVSNDGGSNWRVVSFPSPPPVFSAVALSPAFLEDGVALAGSLEDGIFRSEDRGQNWTSAAFGLLDLKTFCLELSPAFSENETVLTGTESGIFRSTNGGRAWREIPLPIGYEAVLSLASSPDFKRDSMILAGTETKGLLASTDGGQTWEQVDSAQISGSADAILFSPQFPHKEHILILNEGRLVLSVDGGKNWSPWREGEPGMGGVTAVFAPQGFATGSTILLAFVDGYILKLDI
jgi:photosystem II stability/assembly factor-like uncharacterized protein